MNDDSEDSLTLVSEPEFVNNYMKIRASISTGEIEEANFFPIFRGRERIELEIPANFPIAIPSVKFLSDQYWRYPSVQWGNIICFYQALNIEWKPTDTMFGFLQNLDYWLKSVVTEKLNRTDIPLTPPATFSVEPRNNIVIRENNPKFGKDRNYWLGYGIVKSQNGHLYEIEEWKDYMDDFETEKILATSVFFNFGFRYNYPKNLYDLFNLFSSNGVDLDQFGTVFSKQIASTSGQEEIFLVVGIPKNEGKNSKGISDNITVWSISVGDIDSSTLNSNQEIIQSIRDGKNFESWTHEFDVNWCKVIDERKSIPDQQVTKTNLDWFQGKNILILGCGTIGSKIAEFIVRAGVKSLTIVDNDSVVTNNLSPQVYYSADVGLSKSSALEERLNRISNDVKINGLRDDLLDGIYENVYHDEFNLIIDTTRSLRVASIFELEMKKNKFKCPIVSCSISSAAEYGLQIIRNPQFSNGMVSLEREAKIVSNVTDGVEKFAHTFWPSNSIKQNFHPKTEMEKAEFFASAADISWYASNFLTNLNSKLSERSLDQLPNDFAEIQFSSRVNNINYSFNTRGAIDSKSDLEKGYSVLIYPAAINKIQATISQHARHGDQIKEIGGFLYGDISEAYNCAWIDFASGPPPETEFSELSIDFSSIGTSESNNYYSNQTGKDTEFIGIWHTHPTTSAIPTKVDEKAILRILDSGGSSLNPKVFLIIGDSNSENPRWEFWIYTKRDFEDRRKHDLQQ